MMSLGLLITIEANDGSGKETQSNRLLQRLESMGYPVKLVSFPNYASEASSPVKMYLRGEFGKTADDVSPFAASVFFAVDRYASYKKDWQSFYQEGGIIIADRYTTANMVHQATKFEDDSQIKDFIAWLEDFEYQVMGIPKPDMTFFLDVPFEHSLSVIRERANKIDGSETKDIHERDESHVLRAYQCAQKVGEMCDWIRIPCMRDAKFKPIDEIHNMIFEHVKAIIETKGYDAPKGDDMLKDDAEKKGFVENV